ncbi:MAG TPA: rhodanese-like domain-containing protein [Thermoanaerobaculia bacterium]|nr:rhodanese-like domain-containing protein [Thermoanaerobaculia bacterium]
MTAFPPPAPPAAAPVAEEARRISVEDAKKAFDAKRAVIVDVRAMQQWGIEHVKGSIHIPEADLMGRLGELPKDKMIITYCS